QAPVVIERAEIDDLVGLERQPPGGAAGSEEQLLEPVRRPPVVRRLVPLGIDRRDPPPEVQRRAGRLRLAPDLLLGLALPQGLRQRRAVVGRMRLGAHQGDRARRVRLVEGLGRGVSGHAAADDEIRVVGHWAWGVVYGQYTLPLDQLDRRPARCRFSTCQAPISSSRSPPSRCSTNRSGGVFISSSPSGDTRWGGTRRPARSTSRGRSPRSTSTSSCSRGCSTRAIAGSRPAGGRVPAGRPSCTTAPPTSSTSRSPSAGTCSPAGSS